MKKILILAGTDPLSGAGIVADAMTARAHNVFPLVIPTAFVNQDSNGVYDFALISPDLVAKTIMKTIKDASPVAIKIGMLGSAEMAKEVFSSLVFCAKNTPIVLDPVLAGGGPTGGKLAHSEKLVSEIITALRPNILITPNALELGALVQQKPAKTTETLLLQAKLLAKRTSAKVFAKGGHTQAANVDVFVDQLQVEILVGQKCWKEDIHGTGCALSTAIVSSIANGSCFFEAVKKAKNYLTSRVDAGVIQIGLGRPQIFADFNR